MKSVLTTRVSCPPENRRAREARLEGSRSLHGAEPLSACSPLARWRWLIKWPDAQPPGERAQSVSPPARAESRRMVSVGRRSVRQGAWRGQADLSLDRVFHVPLVSRNGARVVRARCCRGGAQPALRIDQ